MVKLRRFGVAASSRADHRALTEACVRRLESAGIGPPASLGPVSGSTLAADGGPIDFVLDFSRSSNIIADGLPFGIWRFEIDGGDRFEPPAAARRASVRAALVAVLTDGTRVVLQEGVLPVWASYRRTRAFLDEVCAGWVARAAAEIQADGWSALRREPATNGSPIPANHRPRSAFATADWLLTSPWRRLHRWWRETARYDTWNVGIATLPSPPRSVADLRGWSKVQWLAPQPPLYFIADPFPYRVNGRDALLVEHYGHPKGVRGRISSIDVDGAQTKLTPVIVRDTHLSYPFTFVDGEHVYCAAEMGQEDGCIIYQLQPDGAWAARHHILRGRKIVDPTVVLIDGTWWLFCTDDRGAGSLMLHAYFADEIGGTWAAHALNPLKCDLSSSRPAGRPFRVAGRLYRPAQDCSETYGGAVNVMEILELGPTRFREEIAIRLEPDPSWPYPDGLHHLVVDGCRLYFDAKRRRYDHLLWLKVWLHRAAS